MEDEQVLNEFLESGVVETERIRELIKKRKVFPCFFGSALKLQGIQEFLQKFDELTLQNTYPDNFSARVFKISRDQQGNRLTHLKITGGSLKVKDLLKGTSGEEQWEEKVNEIRMFT